LLANIYLNPLDWQMSREGHQMVRYADDMVILCPDAESAARVLQSLREWMAQAGLTLHPEKTKIDSASLHPFGAACRLSVCQRCHGSQAGYLRCAPVRSARLWIWGNPRPTSTFWDIGSGAARATGA